MKTSQGFSPPSLSPSPATDAYAAGLIDGEGTIYIDRNLCPRLEIQMAERAQPTLVWMQCHYGGTVKPSRAETEKWAATWRWTVFGDDTEAVLRRIKPSLQVKAAQADVALRLCSLKERNQQVKWDPRARAEAERLRERMMELNRRGPQVPSMDPFAPPNGTLIARHVDGFWVTDQMSLFGEVGLQMYCEAWPSSGSMTSHGVYSIPGITECPSGGGVSSSLLDVLEETVPARYSLSPRAAAGILRRAQKRGRELPEALRTALESLARSHDGTARASTPPSMTGPSS